MGDLTNKQISQTYDALIQTGTDGPIDGVLRPLQDGLGNNLPVEVSTTGVNFTGSVTGDNNTTYDFGAAGAAGNINFALSGSDATNDVVIMQAGTNITLTDNGSNTFTIDAAGGGGGASQMAFSPGTKVSWTGPVGQDTIVWEVLIPANTITGAAQLEFRAPVFEGSEGQWIYSSFGIGPNQGAPNFSYLNILGRQTISGGGDPHMWYRSMNVYANGTVAFKDHNDYGWPGGGGDPVQEVTNIDWSVNQYFQGYCWADSEIAKWDVYNPTLTIIQ